MACTALAIAACDDAVLLTHAEEQLRIANAVSQTLARSIETLPGVASAQVHLVLSGEPALADGLAPAPQASVLVHAQAASSQVDVAGVQALVAGAVSQLTPAAVHVVVAPPKAILPVPPKLAHVGPFVVAASSADGLRALLITLFAVQALLALITCFAVARKRSVAR